MKVEFFPYLNPKAIEPPKKKCWDEAAHHHFRGTVGEHLRGPKYIIGKSRFNVIYLGLVFELHLKLLKKKCVNAEETLMTYFTLLLSFFVRLQSEKESSQNASLHLFQGLEPNQSPHSLTQPTQFIQIYQQTRPPTAARREKTLTPTQPMRSTTDRSLQPTAPTQLTIPATLTQNTQPAALIPAQPTKPAQHTRPTAPG